MSKIHQELKIYNMFKEELDVLIQGEENSKKIIIFVHGFGTNKHEGVNLFDDISKELLSKYLMIRYDASGFGKSQGLTKTFSIAKGAQDFNIILNYVREKYPNHEKLVIAHSMGLYFSTTYIPLDISQFIFTGLPNTQGIKLKESLIKRIENSGGEYKENGISIYKRSSGQIQEFSSDFFNSLENFDSIKNITYLVRNSNSNIKMFKPIQDTVVINSDFTPFKELLKDNYIELNGDHDFSDIEDRKVLINHIKDILL